jgi:hypothetical protein
MEEKEEQDQSFWSWMKSRSMSPFYSTFIISWLIINWRFPYYLFAQTSLTVSQKFSFIDGHLYPGSIRLPNWLSGVEISWEKILFLYLLPFIVTTIVIYGFDKFVTLKFYAQSMDNKVKKRDQRTMAEQRELLEKKDQEIIKATLAYQDLKTNLEVNNKKMKSKLDTTNKKLVRSELYSTALDSDYKKLQDYIEDMIYDKGVVFADIKLKNRLINESSQEVYIKMNGEVGRQKRTDKPPF